MNVVLAAVDFETLEGVAAPNLSGHTVAYLFSRSGGLITYFIFFAGAALLIYSVFSGFQFLMSRGDPKAVQQAKGKITNALIGFIIVFTAYWIVQIMSYILSLESIRAVFS